VKLSVDPGAAMFLAAATHHVLQKSQGRRFQASEEFENGEARKLG